MQDPPSKTSYAHFQTPIAVGSVGSMVDLSRDVTDVAEFDQLLGIEAPTKSDGFVSLSDDVVPSSDDFVHWPDSSGSAIDAPVEAFDALTGLQASVTDFDAITGSEASVIDSYTPIVSAPTSG